MKAAPEVAATAPSGAAGEIEPRARLALWRSSALAVPLITLSVFVIVSALLVGALYWQASRALTRLALEQSESELRELATDGGFVPLEILPAAIERRIESGSLGLYFLTDANGRKRAGNLNRWPPEIERSSGGGFFGYETHGGSRHIAVGVTEVLEGGVVLLVGRNVDAARLLASSLWWWFIGALGVMSVLGIAAMIIGHRALLGRVEMMRATSAAIMAGDLAQRIPLAGSGDELDALAQSLNAMLARIEQLMAGLKEVSDNIAHDLKTPLARIRSSVESALRDPRGAPAHREGLERTLEEADELIKTFNALLLVARLEAGAVEGSAETLDAAALIEDVAELYGPVAEEGGDLVRVELTAEAVPLVANRQLLLQALINLVENALKYGRPVTGGPAEITVSVAVRPGQVVFAVADRGPGIPSGSRERALKRFVRLEASRSQPGTGLGLSLVAAVARLHGGTVELDDNSPGLVVRLVLPARGTD
ncbi:MAG: ATP-binding protein [Hyphomicrobiaceae bacterium]